MHSEEKRRGSPSVCQIYILIRMTYFRASETTEGEIKRAPDAFPIFGFRVFTFPSRRQCCVVLLDNEMGEGCEGGRGEGRNSGSR